ncbi:MAG: hypothetical protein AB8B74_04095 [Crocinitomicaceae bacterium]
MNTVNGIIRVVTYSNIWISLGAVCFSLFASRVLDFELPLFYILFIFSATLFTYNFQRLIKRYVFSSQGISGPRLKWIERNVFSVYLITTISGIAACILGWQFILEIWWLFAVVGFFSLFYVLNLPILKVNLRSIPGVKIFVLGVTWVIATQILPFFLFSAGVLSASRIIFFIGSMLFMLAISIPFDIRDLELDNRKLRTIPQTLGIKNARYLAATILFMSTALFMWVVGYFHIGLLLNTIIVTKVICRSGINGNEFYYSGLADGLLILIYLSYYLA